MSFSQSFSTNRKDRSPHAQHYVKSVLLGCNSGKETHKSLSYKSRSLEKQSVGRKDSKVVLSLFCNNTRNIFESCCFFMIHMAAKRNVRGLYKFQLRLTTCCSLLLYRSLQYSIMTDRQIGFQLSISY